MTSVNASFAPSSHAVRPSAVTSHAATQFVGEARVPGDKSISHRALMLSSQVLGQTQITGLLEGEDVLATAGALRALGVNVQRVGDSEWTVLGVGIGGFAEPTQVLDMGNAGTGARLMMGLLASYPFVSLFTGDASLCSRPMQRVMTPLQQIGATFMSRDKGRMPLAMQGTSAGLPIEYRLPVASAQVKSAVILAALNVAGITTVIEPIATRDHTERMLQGLGIAVDVAVGAEGERIIKVRGHQQSVFSNRSIVVPADPSSAAFPAVAALLVKGADVTLTGVCMNPLRTGLYDTLKEMGADITYINERIEAGEPIADLRVRFSTLHGVEVPAERAPSMIDEYPVLAVAASFASGVTVMHGLEELRVKESDRLQAIVDGLNACGVRTEVDGDTLRVFGQEGIVQGGGLIKTRLDHRIAMSFLVMGMASQQPVTIDDDRAIATSFPAFIALMNRMGADMRVLAQEAGAKPSSGAAHRKAPRRVIAIDGPAASGKGTLARRLADYYGYAYLDTGSLYRAVGMKVVYSGNDPQDKAAALAAAKSLSDHDLANPKLRQEHVGNAASVVSAMPEVRAALLDYQRTFAARPEGAVLDGRDIGTVVCPHADVKIFVTASLEARADRRHRELQGQGVEVVPASVLKDLRARDERDAKRDAAPMKAAEDAILLDTTFMKADEVFESVVKMIEKA